MSIVRILACLILFSACGLLSQSIHYHASSALLPTTTPAAPPFVVQGTGFDQPIYAMALDNNGLLLVAGQFSNYNGTSVAKIVRLKTDGTLDPAFNLGGVGPDGMVQSIALDTSHNIYIGGQFTHVNGISAPYLARLTPTGMLDGSFTQTGTGLDATVYVVQVDPGTQGPVVAGNFAHYNGAAAPYVARLTTTGSIDGSFAMTGNGLNYYCPGLAIDSSRNVIVGGGFNHYDLRACPSRS